MHTWIKLSLFAVQQRLAQYCKSTISIKNKIKEKTNKNNNKNPPKTPHNASTKIYNELENKERENDWS